MFVDCTSFNQDLSKWKVGAVTDMYGMFWGASKFNKPIGNWNMSNVVSIGSMFAYASRFNQNISRWNGGWVRVVKDLSPSAVCVCFHY